MRRPEVRKAGVSERKLDLVEVRAADLMLQNGNAASSRREHSGADNPHSMRLGPTLTIRGQ